MSNDTEGKPELFCPECGSGQCSQAYRDLAPRPRRTEIDRLRAKVARVEALADNEMSGLLMWQRDLILFALAEPGESGKA